MDDLYGYLSLNISLLEIIFLIETNLLILLKQIINLYFLSLFNNFFLLIKLLANGCAPKSKKSIIFFLIYLSLNLNH